MSGIGDGEESWSEDDLFDLDSAHSFGARIEEIAVFFGREVEDVERKALERSLPNSAKLGLTAPNRTSKKKGCRQVEKVGLEFSRLHPAGSWRRPW
jgi:hypothetical protein